MNRTFFGHKKAGSVFGLYLQFRKGGGLQAIATSFSRRCRYDSSPKKNRLPKFKDAALIPYAICRNPTSPTLIFTSASGLSGRSIIDSLFGRCIKTLRALRFSSNDSNPTARPATPFGEVHQRPPTQSELRKLKCEVLTTQGHLLTANFFQKDFYPGFQLLVDSSRSFSRVIAHFYVRLEFLILKHLPRAYIAHSDLGYSKYGAV